MLHSAMSDSSPDLQSQLQFILNRFDSNTNSQLIIHCSFICSADDQGAEASLEQDSEEDEEVMIIF